MVRQLDGVLRHPQAIGERMGLQLGKRLAEDADFAATLTALLNHSLAQDAKTEQEMIAAALAPVKSSGAKPLNTQLETVQNRYAETEIRPGLMARLHRADGRVELSGAAMTSELRGRLLSWLKTNN